MRLFSYVFFFLFLSFLTDFFFSLLLLGLAPWVYQFNFLFETRSFPVERSIELSLSPPSFSSPPRRFIFYLYAVFSFFIFIFFFYFTLFISLFSSSPFPAFLFFSLHSSVFFFLPSLETVVKFSFQFRLVFHLHEIFTFLIHLIYSTLR